MIEALQNYSWPGNVRELQNAVDRAAILSTGREPQEADFLLKTQRLCEQVEVSIESPTAAGQAEVLMIRSGTTVGEMEKALILETLEATNNNRTEASRLLGISIREEGRPKALAGWAACIKRIYGIDPLECPRCKAQIRIVAFIQDGPEIKNLMASLGLPDFRAPPKIKLPALQQDFQQMPDYESPVMRQSPGRLSPGKIRPESKHLYDRDVLGLSLQPQATRKVTRSCFPLPSMTLLL